MEQGTVYTLQVWVEKVFLTVDLECLDAGSGWDIFYWQVVDHNWIFLLSVLERTN